ncbi:conserved hypothetical protein [Candidatus Pelagibacter sp. HTCC7211]|uniref:hypothetical protein n=1 Tax=Pelagibacter sp. (strain HTCC7211) TaxID=439493 RepID=UPI000183A8D7|nr:hypothetical protein [Candidatus Pelagibacter sp. HTCC7211]EDZ60943.1 conserved hypothetical protein [Candidatus Pelagibacter sp. HTCC7211]MBD1151166.1 hypothetical protein [Pelagibacterales bacterium SAG-MED25]
MKLLIKSFLNFFWRLHKSKLKKNKTLENLYKGNSCVIIGNGGSIKYFDIKRHEGFFYMGTTYAMFHKEIENLKPDFYVIPQKHDFYPFNYSGRYKSKLYINYRLKIYKNIFKKAKQTRFFINLSNYYGFFKRPKLLNFFYSFKDLKSTNGEFEYDLTNNFNCTEGSLGIMIGISKYLGFKRIILIGCDYLGTPKLEGHFYSNSDPRIGEPIYESYIKKIKKLTHDMEVITIFPKGISSNEFKSFTYDEFFEKNYNKKTQIKKNYEIISREDLNLLNEASKSQLII